MKQIKVAVPTIGKEEITAVTQVLKSGNYVSGEKVAQFEDAFSKYIGTKHAVAVNSGTSALHLSLLALGVGNGDEVIVPSMTFFSTISAVIMCGATPVFADVDSYANIDIDSIREQITERTKVIIPVHLYGMPCNIKQIIDLATLYDIDVIEDCAQAHGAKFCNDRVGSIGDIGCFSFFATKNMTTGEGGMITTNNSDVANWCYRARAHGMVDRHSHAFLGYNYRMTEMEAAIGIEQLEKLDFFNRARQDIAFYYNSQFDYPFRLYKDGNIHYGESVECVYFWYPVRVGNKHSARVAIEYLREKGIETRFRYEDPLYRQPIFKNKYKDLNLPIAEKLAGTIIGLPIHPKLTEEEVKYVVQTWKKLEDDYFTEGGG